MDTLPPDLTTPVSLDSILCRDDTWRGESQHKQELTVIKSGYPALDTALNGGGWPIGGLVEICQSGFTQQEWLMFRPALMQTTGLIVLLNPPLIPFAQGLLVAGLSLERVRVVQATKPNDFVSCFIEVTRNTACGALLSWQPTQNLSYTELRKCSLAASEGNGLYTLFRPAGAQQQSSPASLRMLAGMRAQELSIAIFKQRGNLQSDLEISLPLSDDYMAHLPFHLLDLYEFEDGDIRPRPKAPVVPLRRGIK